MTVRIRPTKGTRVLMPDGQVLPAEGADVTMDLYWRRRIDDGDVTVGMPPRKPAEEKSA